MSHDPSPESPQKLQAPPPLSLAGLTPGVYRPVELGSSAGSLIFSPSDPHAAELQGSLWSNDIVQETEAVAADLKKTPSLMEKFDPQTIQHIASGGMGHVFAAWDKTLNRWQAIKVLSNVGSTSAMENFRAEASLVANLTHPGLLKIYDFGASSEERPYFTMDLVSGAQTFQHEVGAYYGYGVGSFKEIEWRSRENPLMRFFLESLTALEYLHKEGVVHRDLKPGNILISTQNERSSGSVGDRSRKVYVTDFGLSLTSATTEMVNQEQAEGQSEQTERASRMTQVFRAHGHLFKGTIEYAAPEQARAGGVLTPRTDVYQLGLILRYMLTGEQPFDGKKGFRAEVLELIRNASNHRELYGEPKKINQHIPPELLSIVDKALAVDPEKRYADAGELKRDLEAYLDNRSVRAHRESLSGGTRLGYATQVAAKQTVGWVLSHKGVSATLLAATIGTGVGVNSLLRSRNREAEQRMAELREQEESKRIALEVDQRITRAEELRDSARKMADIGKLDTAVALVAQETLKDFKQWSPQSQKLLELVNLLEKETLERQAILDMRLFEMKGYMAGIINDNPADLGPFDKELLRKALEQFIPGGLTDKSLEAFRKKMSESGYSQEQRREIAAGIARVSLVLMVGDVDRIPWDLELDPKVRRQMIVEVEMITKFCEACGVINREMPGRFEVPTALNALTCSIKESLNEYFQPILDPNDLWKGDVTMLYLPVLPEVLAGRNSMEHAEQLGRAASKEPDSVLLGMMAVSVGTQTLLADVEALGDNISTSFSQFSGIVRCQLLAYRAVARMSLERHELGMRFVRLMKPMILTSRGIPMGRRPDMFELVVGATEVLSDLENTYPEVQNSPEVQELKCLLKLIVGSPLSDRTVAVVAGSPLHREVGAYLTAWRQALLGLEIDSDNADMFLRSDLARRDPLTAVLVLHRLGRNDEAFELLERLVEKDEAWRDDLKSKATNELAGVRAAHYIRYDELAYGTDQ